MKIRKIFLGILSLILVMNLFISCNDSTLLAENVYIKYAVYDNNRTQTVDDDKLYLYINKEIDVNSINSDMSMNYTLDGVGVIGSGSTSDYDDTIFHRHTISLNSEGTSSTPLNPEDTNISFNKDYITDTNGIYPSSLDKVVVKNYNILGRISTGQTLCYDDRMVSTPIDCNDTHALKDDGYYHRGAIRTFTDNGDTVTDDISGLIWQQEDDNITKTWADAVSYCDNLILDGNSDFRLPTAFELTSIVDHEASNPAIYSIFTNTNTGIQYWSFNTDDYAPGKAFNINFQYGQDGHQDQINVAYVRCVR